MKIKHKKTNQILPIKYEKWVENIVNLGNAHEFEILEFPDIVQLIFIQPSGNSVNDKILDRIDAISLISKYPRHYTYAEIEVKNQILTDIKASNQIKNYKSLFSRLSRIARKIRMIRYPKITLTKKQTVDLSILIIGTIMAYAIMKYIFKWV